MRKDKRKDCPRCLVEHKKRGTLIECEYTESGQKYYVCAWCNREFDFNHKSSCHKAGIMIDRKGVGDPRGDIIVDFYCLKCGKKCR